MSHRSSLRFWAWSARRRRTSTLLRPRLRVIGAGLAAFGLVVIALVTAWTWWIAAGIDLSRLAEPSVVYAAPRVLEPGLSVTTTDLAGTLQRLGYQEVTEEPRGPGEFLRAGAEWDIFLRALFDYDSTRPALRIRLNLDGDRVRAIVHATDRTKLERVALEPEVLGDLGDLTYRLRRPVPLPSIPRHVVAAVLAAEDRRYFEHAGVDFWAIGRATWANLRHRRIVEGGSTITQQLAKSLDGGRRAWIDKVRSTLLALALEQRYTKAEILEAYLNTVYLGEYGPLTMYGLGAAAITYFQKDVGALDVAEAATLAGMIHGPNRYSPVHNPYATRERRNLVLRRMRDYGHIGPAAFVEATLRSIAVQPIPPRTPVGLHFFDHVLAELGQRYLASGAPVGGLRIYTTFDLVLQRTAETVLNERLAQLERRYRHLWRWERTRRLQGALIALDASTGEIRALVGSRDYWVSRFNRATHARRHPGSTFKPFVYLAALRGGAHGEPPSLTAGSLLQDEPVTVEDNGQSWSPRNTRSFFLGPVTVRQALVHSLNAPAVSTALRVGLEAVIRTARDVGFTSPMIARPPLAVGAVDVVPLELAVAYATLANAGLPVPPTSIRAVLNRSELPPRRISGRSPVGVTPEEAYVTTHLLLGVMESGTGAMSRPLGLTVPAAGKTGSTHRDAWVVGYTPRLVALTWLGFDDSDKLHLSGARGALPIWVDFMRTAVEVVPTGSFSIPPAVVFRDVDVTTGKLATPFCWLAIREAFLPSTVPTEACADHRPSASAATTIRRAKSP